VRHRRLVGGIDLLGVVAAPAKLLQLLVGVAVDHAGQLRVAPEKILANIVAAGHGVHLILAVGHLLHPFDQQPLIVLGQQRVPVIAPDHLDGIPTGPAKGRLQLLDDFAVAAHRPVQALKVAVDHKNQVVQLLPGRQGNGPQCFRLVGLTVAQKRPYPPVVRRLDAPVFHIAVEAGLVDGHDWRQAHGDGGKLPEVGHEIRMGI
jgi:hypothetical protein